MDFRRLPRVNDSMLKQPTPTYTEMSYCTHCGKQLPDGVKFCTGCGASLPSGGGSSQNVPPVQHSQPYPYPHAVPASTLEEPISTGSYVGILLLLMIPVVNLLCVLIWACGGCNKRNLTNLSRAMLVWMLISTVIAFLVALAAGALMSEHLNGMKDAIEELNKMSETYHP